MRDYEIASVDYDAFYDCPEDYQQDVIRIMSMQAYAELHGALQVGMQLKLAPNALLRKRLAKIIYDEASHAYSLYDILEKLGVKEADAVGIAEGKNTQKTSSLEGVIAVGSHSNTWIDLVLNHFLMDRAGSFMVGNFAASSFAPWASACQSILKDEQWHIRFGLDGLVLYLQSHSLDSVKPYFARWYIHALNFFGPARSRSHERLKTYGIKRLCNHELRSHFMVEVEQVLSKHHWQSLLPEMTEDYPYRILGEEIIA